MNLPEVDTCSGYPNPGDQCIVRKYFTQETASDPIVGSFR
jgi:hypothetical protein